MNAKQMYKILLAGKKVLVLNADTKKKFVVSLKKENDVDFKQLLQISDTNVNDGFMGIVSNIGLMDTSFNGIRNAENDTSVDFVLFRSTKQTLLKKNGITLVSI